MSTVRCQKPELRETSVLSHETGGVVLTAPRRYWMTATIDLVATASLDPSSPGPVAEPPVKEPPWILRAKVSLAQLLADGNSHIPHERRCVTALRDRRWDVEYHRQAVLRADGIIVGRLHAGKRQRGDVGGAISSNKHLVRTAIHAEETA